MFIRTNKIWTVFLFAKFKKFRTRTKQKFANFANFFAASNTIPSSAPVESDDDEDDIYTNMFPSADGDANDQQAKKRRRTSKGAVATAQTSKKKKRELWHTALFIAAPHNADMRNFRKK